MRSTGGTLGTDFLTVSAPTPPHQPGSPSTIAKAADARVTDAVWRNNHLWFVATHDRLGRRRQHVHGQGPRHRAADELRRPRQLRERGPDGHLRRSRQGRLHARHRRVRRRDGLRRLLGVVGVAVRQAIKAAAYKPGVGWSDDITIADGEGTYWGHAGATMSAWRPTRAAARRSGNRTRSRRATATGGRSSRGSSSTPCRRTPPPRWRPSPRAH